jgi:hypothetical protein
MFIRLFTLVHDRNISSVIDYLPGKEDFRCYYDQTYKRTFRFSLGTPVSWNIRIPLIDCKYF